MSAASNPTRRTSTCSTVGTTAAASARCAASNSTSIRCGARRPGRRPARCIEAAAARVIISVVRAGGRQIAAYRLTHRLTATRSASGAYCAASAQARSSPVTTSTGTPCSTASAAFSPPSPAGSPSSRTPVTEFSR
jgi:hypothetical protein